MRSYLTEFVGTFFLCLTVGMTVLSGSPQAGIAIGSALMVMVYMGGHISGGHYNPAVTLAVFLRGKLPSGQVFPYMLSQLVGAMAAALVTRLLVGDMASPDIGGSASVGGAVINELLFSFALCLVVLNVATSKKTEGNSYYGLAIGFTVVVGATAGGGVSGGAYNPAVGVGLGLVRGLLTSTPMTHLWIYIVGPFLGAVLAARVFKIQEAEA